MTNAEVQCGLYPAGSAGQYLIVEEKAAVVRRLFADYAAGVSLNKLARALTAEGITAPNGAPAWPLASLRYLLSNTAYKGEAAFGKRMSRADESRLHQTHPRTGLPLTDMRHTKPRPPEEWTNITCPALVSEDIWDTVQGRFTQNRAEMSGNPRRVYMLAGRTFCPLCGGSMTAWGGGHKQKDGSPKLPRYICLRHVQKNAAGLPAECSGWSRLVGSVEADAQAVLLSLARNPTAIDDAEAEYRQPLKRSVVKSTTALRSELAALEQALTELAKDDLLAVQAQIAGMRVGASPDAYSAVFSDLAARRKDLEDRRGALSRQLRTSAAPPPKSGRTRTELEAQALEDAALVLSAPDVPGSVKRDIIGKVITRVECGVGYNRKETRVFVPKEFTTKSTPESDLTETRNIVLIGFMGTGKSAVGRVLARRLNVRHLDTDCEIERSTGKTIPQIFAEEGEAAFRARETAFLTLLAASHHEGDHLILSTGGGTPLREENAALLKRAGTVVWLRVAPEAILARVAHSLHERPLLAAHQEDPLGRISSLLAIREPQYAAVADLVLETSDCADSEEGAARLLDQLEMPA